jgi:hypothetical protein
MADVAKALGGTTRLSVGAVLGIVGRLVVAQQYLDDSFTCEDPMLARVFRIYSNELVWEVEQILQRDPGFRFKKPDPRTHEMPRPYIDAFRAQLILLDIYRCAARVGVLPS